MQCYVEQKIKHPGSTVWALSVCLFLKVGHHLQLFLAVETEILLASGRNAKRDVHRYIWSRSHVLIVPAALPPDRRSDTYPCARTSEAALLLLVIAIKLYIVH
jgi:hypothetical protein